MPLLITGRRAVVLLAGVFALSAGCGKPAGTGGDGPGGASATGDDQEVPHRAPRDLPAEVFTFYPGEPHRIEYWDYDLEPASRPKGDRQAERIGLPVTSIRQWAEYKRGDFQTEQVGVYLFGEAFDLAAAAGGKGFRPGGPADRPVYRSHNDDVACFQPSAKAVVVVRTNPGDRLGENRVLADLAARRPVTVTFPADLRAAIREVSGYAHIHASVSAPEDQRWSVKHIYHVNGTTVSATEVEDLICEVYKTPDDSRKARQDHAKWNRNAAQLSKTSNAPEMKYWYRENMLIRLSVRPRGK